MSKILDKIAPIVAFLRKYHTHSVLGLEKIPKEGPALVLFNHSLATYDIGLFGHAVYEKRGRLIRVLADHIFFKNSWSSQLVRGIGGVDGNMSNGRKLLDEGELVGIAPGGMRESLRPSSERYQIRWGSRKGFAKLAMEAQVPVVVTVCPKADDLYDVYPSSMTKVAYKKLKIPLFFARGWGPTLIPRPIKLTHYVADPIYPPKMPKTAASREKAIKKFHQQIIHTAQDLVAKAVVTPELLD